MLAGSIPITLARTTRHTTGSSRGNCALWLPRASRARAGARHQLHEPAGKAHTRGGARCRARQQRQPAQGCPLNPTPRALHDAGARRQLRNHADGVNLNHSGTHSVGAPLAAAHGSCAQWLPRASSTRAGARHQLHEPAGGAHTRGGARRRARQQRQPAQGCPLNPTPRALHSAGARRQRVACWKSRYRSLLRTQRREGPRAMAAARYTGYCRGGATSCMRQLAGYAHGQAHVDERAARGSPRRGLRLSRMPRALHGRRRAPPAARHVGGANSTRCGSGIQRRCAL